MHLRACLIALAAMLLLPVQGWAFDASKQPSSTLNTLNLDKLVVQGANSTGPISKMCTAYPGTAFCRTFEDRAADYVVNVKDFGILGDGSNETTRINDAIVQVAGKAALYFPKTTACYSSEQVNLVSYTHIILDGTVCRRNLATSLDPSFPVFGRNAMAVDGPAFAVADDTNFFHDIVVEGSGTINGSSPARNTNRGYACFGANHVMNLVVRGLTITDCNINPISIAGKSKNILLKDLVVQNAGNSAQCAAIVDNCVVDNVTFVGIRDHAWAFYGGVTNSKIVNSHVYNGEGVGIIVLSDGHATPAELNSLPSSDIVIANNVIHNNFASAISVSIDDTVIAITPDARHRGIVISGNVGHHNAQDTSTSTLAVGGVYINRSINTAITGNVFREDGNGRPGFGINIATSVDGLLIAGNTISNQAVNAPQPAISYGIAFDPTTIRLNIAGNTITDAHTPQNMAWAIAGTAVDGSQITINDNIAGPSANTPAIKVDMANDTIVNGFMRPPSAANSYCVTGAKAFDATHQYQCVAPSSWTRSSMAPW